MVFSSGWLAGRVVEDEEETKIKHHYILHSYLCSPSISITLELLRARDMVIIIPTQKFFSRVLSLDSIRRTEQSRLAVEGLWSIYGGFKLELVLQ